MKKDGFWYRAWDLYYDGFRSMTLGRTLWIIIGIKLFIIFAILKVFFFPNFLRQHVEKGSEAEFVASELTERMTNGNSRLTISMVPSNTTFLAAFLARSSFMTVSEILSQPLPGDSRRRAVSAPAQAPRQA